MWLKRFTLYLLENRWQALALTFAITSLCLFGVVGCLIASIGIIIAAMITLVKGANEGALFTAAATLPFAVYYIRGDISTDAPLVLVWGLLTVVVSINLLTWFMAALLHRRMRMSTVLQIAALSGILFVSVVHLVNPAISTWWNDQFSQVQTYTAKHVPELAPLVVPVKADKPATDATQATTTTGWGHQPTQAEMIGSITGALTAAILLFATIQLMIARWWQSVIFRRSLSQELHTIRLTPLAGISLLICIALQFWGNEVVLDILPILSLLFVGAGLSIVHYVIGLQRPAVSWALILTFYTLLILVLQQVGMLLLIMLGLIDIWFPLRSSMPKKFM